MPLTNLPQELLGQLNLLDLERLRAFQFAVQIDGQFPGAKYLVGFDRIDGLESRVRVREIKEGGYAGTHQFPREQQATSLVLHRGMTYSRELYNWYQEVINWEPPAPSFRRTLTVSLLDRLNTASPINRTVQLNFEVWQWQINDAFPVAWTGPRLNSKESEFAFESLEIRHSGISEAQGILSGTVGTVAGLFQ